MTDEKTSIPMPPPPGHAPKGSLRRADASLTACMPTLWPAFKWLNIAFLALCLLLVLAVLVNNYLGAHTLAAAQQPARDRGLALSMKEYLTSLPDIPQSENAALLYLAAFDRLDEIGVAGESPYIPIISRDLARKDPTEARLKSAKETIDQIDRDARTPLLDYMLDDAKVYLANRADVLASLHEAVALEKSRYPVEWQGFQTPAIHLGKARASARLLGVAAWVDAEEGRAIEAASRIHDSVALARSLEGEPMLVSSLVKIAILAITVGNLQRVAGRTDLPNDDLLLLQEDFRRTLDSLSMCPAFESELAAVSDVFVDLRSGRLPSSGDGESTEPSPTYGRLTAFVHGRSIRVSQAIVTRGLLRILDNIDSPSPEFLAGPDPILDEAVSGDHVLAAMLMPSYSRAFGQGEKTRAKLRATIAGLAALRYYNDHASWPATLDALVPDYIDAVPIDPFTGKPLIYALKDDGIIIYSVGANAVDDGEGYYASPPEGEKRTGDDVGFRIWK